MKLSIIIVNYNTYQLTKQTIDSILNQTVCFNYEIILVDNASKDKSIEKLKEEYKEGTLSQRIRIIVNEENLGFAKANNIGIMSSKGEYVLLLNSDTYVTHCCLEKCIGYIEENSKGQINTTEIAWEKQGNKTETVRRENMIGALGCKIVLENGALDHACKRGFPTPEASLYYLLKVDKKNPQRFGQYDALYLEEDEIGEVDSLMGAFMLMPKKVLDEVGLLDETFFMYGEDIDLCYRIKQVGYKVIYYPEAKIIHYKGGSSKKKRTKVIYDFHNAMWIFYKKHYYKKYNLWITLLVFIGIWVKYLLEITKNFLKRDKV